MSRQNRLLCSTCFPLRNRALTIGFKHISFFYNFHYFLIFIIILKIFIGHAFYQHFHHPKSTKIHNNKKIMIFGNRVLVLEVSQKPFLAFPCCMWSIFFFDRHAAWECDLWLLRHLHSENAIFYFCHTSQARSSEMMRMQFSDHCFGVTSLTARTANRHKNRSYQGSSFFGAKIVLYKNIEICSRTL